MASAMLAGPGQQSGLALLVALLACGLFATVSHPEPLGAAKPAPRRLAHRSKSAEELSASTAEEGGEEGENDKELFWHRALQGLVEEGAEIAAQDVLGTGPLVTSTTNASCEDRDVQFFGLAAQHELSIFSNIAKCYARSICEKATSWLLSPKAAPSWRTPRSTASTPWISAPPRSGCSVRCSATASSSRRNGARLSR